jgi:hypothetical protein
MIPGRLGKLAPRSDHRQLRLSKYLPAKLPAAPPSVDWTTKVKLPCGAMKNDELGDCTCAALGHAIQVWTANASTEVTVSDADVLKLYEGACGYVPGDPSTDQGGIEIDVLNYARKYGIGGHKIDAFVALQPENQEHIKLSVDLFGGVYIGVALPNTIQNQGDTWTLDIGKGRDAMRGSLGGHAVFVTGYDAFGLWFISWGQKYRMSWEFWLAYTDESYALLSQLWAPAGANAPVGFDYAALMADLTAVAT